MEEYLKLNWLKGLDFDAFKKEVKDYPAFLMFDIAELWEKVPQEAEVALKRLYLYGEAAQRGDSRAVTFMGGFYASAMGEDDDSALFYLNKAIRKYNNPEAMLKLGLFYRDREKYNECFYWLNKAARHDLADAWLHLGYCYANGYGVEQDIDKARQLYDKAIEKGNGEAMYYKAITYIQIVNASSDIMSIMEECKSLFQKASMHGCALATEGYLSIFLKA